MSVKSVYNFVPAPKENEVFKPDWANKVSHDIPFEDGESGEIEIKITAKTSIFIRNGHSKQDAEDNTERYQEFSNIERNGKKEYFIPGSSLKGMFRNVLEIMSFSRMKKIADDRYSFRDLSRNSLYMESYKSNDVKGGWLIQDNDGNWKIEECKELAFIHHKELKKKNIPFRDLFLNKQPKEKIAEYKYKIVNDNLLNAKFSTYTKELFGNVTRQMANYDDNGESGTLVFTGQSGKRIEYTDQKRKPSGKIHEFVFFNAENPNIIPIEEKMQKDFKFIYLDHDKQNISKDWRFWRNKLEKGEKIPVFFNKKSKNEVKHFGLSFMYKLPFEHSIHETLPFKEYNKKKKDLTELIFGSINDSDTSLKGRVFISHSFSDNAIEGEEKKEILAGPKASYFPFYLSQPKNKRDAFYNTYMDEDAEIRGYKRYPIQNRSNEGHYDNKQLKNNKVFSVFKPLEEGASFKSKIRFHNLKKSEIGALLSAITFHGNESKSYHTIGGAKPFGYGQISVSGLVLKGLDNTKDEYLSEFENLMGDDEWINSPQLTELITMAQTSDASLEYPEDPKTFVDYKNDKEILEKYSTIVDKPSKIQSIAKQVELKDNLDDFSFNSTKFNGLKDHIKELGYIEVPEYLHPNLKKAIIEIYQNHKASMRKLNKPFDESYDWHTVINNWVGQETAQQWYKEITNK